MSDQNSLVPFFCSLDLRDRPGMRETFIKAVFDNQAEFGLDLGNEIVGRLADHYEMVIEANPLLHLVGPCSAEEFATRHVLESLTLLEHLPANARFADVGTGAGFPSIPCLLARDDLTGTLIESKEKKAVFLSEAIEQLGIAGRASIVNRQFEEASSEGCGFVTCRALDKFSERLPRLLKWSLGRKLLLFGGHNLRDELDRGRAGYSQKLMPLSEQRFLFVLEN